MQTSFKLAAATAAVLGTLACGTTNAANVEIYGLVDMGAKLMRDGGETTFELNSGQINGSRFGLRGSEDLGNGYNIGFALENGFDADTGALADEDRLFNRGATLSISGPFGELTMGRTGALVSGNSGGIFAGKVSPFGITWQESQSSQILSGPVGSRVDNSLTYESPSMAGLSLHAQVSNGIDLDDSVSSSRKDRYAALGATYKNGPLQLVLVVDRMFTKNTGDSDAYIGDDYSTFNLGGSYDFGTVKLFAGYQYGDGVTRVGKISKYVKGTWSATNETNRTGYDTHAVVLGANIDVFDGTLKVATGYAKGDRDYKQWRTSDGTLQNTFTDKAEGYQFALGYLYPLSKRTDLYVSGAYVHGKTTNETTNWKRDGSVNSVTNTGNNENTRTFICGIRHKF